MLERLAAQFERSMKGFRNRIASKIVGGRSKTACANYDLDSPSGSTKYIDVGRLIITDGRMKKCLKSKVGQLNT